MSSWASNFPRLRPKAIAVAGQVVLGGNEYRAPALAIAGPAQAAHAVVHDHAAGDFRGPLQVVLGPRGNVAVNHFFRQGACQENLDAAFQLALREQIAVAFGPLHRVAQGGQAAGNDRNLVDGIGVRQAGGNQGVGTFVIGDALLLVGMHDPLPLFQSGRDAFHAFGEFLHADRLLAGPGRQQRRLVDQVGQVGADESGGDAGDFPQIDRVVDANLLNVDVENILAAANVRPVDQHVAIETPRAEQGRVERFRPVGGGHHDHAAVGIHAVHFHQQRVEGLLAFVVAADNARAAGLAQGVELVDENDAGGLGHRLLEHVADPRGADADEHFHEVGPRETEERHLRLAGNGLAQQGLARARRPDQQHPLGNAAAKDLVLLGLLEEVDDFAEFFHGFIDAGDFVERHADIFLGQQLPATAAEGHRRACPAQPAEEQDGNDQNARDQRNEHEIALPRAGRRSALEVVKTVGRQAVEQLAVVLIQPVTRASERHVLLGRRAQVVRGENFPRDFPGDFVGSHLEVAKVRIADRQFPAIVRFR